MDETIRLALMAVVDNGDLKLFDLNSNKYVQIESSKSLKLIKESGYLEKIQIECVQMNKEKGYVGL